jgi:hypothetical protein
MESRLPTWISEPNGASGTPQSAKLGPCATVGQTLARLGEGTLTMPSNGASGTPQSSKLGPCATVGQTLARRLLIERHNLGEGTLTMPSRSRESQRAEALPANDA